MDLDGIGYARELQEKTASVLANASPAARARILGRPMPYVEKARPKPSAKPPVVRRLPAAHATVVEPPSRPGPSVEEIIAAILEATGVSRYEFFRELRSNIKISRARQMSYWLIKKVRPDVTFGEMGRLLHRDHTTCLTGIRRGEVLKDTAPICDWLAHPAIVALMGKGGEP